MPIYGFECPSCGHSFDRLQKLSDADPTMCPACQAEGIRRQITAPAFRLSGSGWYETDFKKDGDKKRNLAGDPASNSAPAESAKPAGDAGGTTKSEPAKPTASTSDSKPAPAAASSKPAS